MTDKELLEKAIYWFKVIAEDMERITTGNLSHCAATTKGRAIRAYEFLEKHKEEPVSEDLEEAVNTYIGYPPEVDECSSVYGKRQAFKAGAKWQKQQDSIPSKDLAELIDTLSKRYPEVSFAKLSRIAVRVAKWQKENLWKPADGDDLPEIDREVIALLDNGKVAFAHRPPEYWDGKNIITGKVTRNYPKTYDKGGWNIPNVKWWLDVELPKEIEL